MMTSPRLGKFVGFGAVSGCLWSFPQHMKSRQISNLDSSIIGSKQPKTSPVLQLETNPVDACAQFRSAGDKGQAAARQEDQGQIGASPSSPEHGEFARAHASLAFHGAAGPKKSLVSRREKGISY